jgi:hypothetical protein
LRTREPERETWGQVSATPTGGITGQAERGKEATVYIGGGVLAVIIVILLLIWLL